MRSTRSLRPLLINCKLVILIKKKSHEVITTNRGGITKLKSTFLNVSDRYEYVTRNST